MRDGIAAAEAEPPADPALLFEHAYVDPPPRSRRPRRAEADPRWLSSRSSRRSTTRCTPSSSATLDVLVMGEDVGRAGGVFRATAGLRDRFGADRCVDTPLAEAGILGTAIGLCMAGWRPVCEMQYDAFSLPVPRPADQPRRPLPLADAAARMEFPITIRMPYGGGVRAPELHDDSPEAYYVHTPGVKVAIPSTPADAKGLLAAAIRDPDPVVDPRAEARTTGPTRGEVPGRRARRAARAGADRARGHRPDARRLRRDGRASAEQAADELDALGRGARPALAQAARRGGAARLGRRRRAAS